MTDPLPEAPATGADPETPRPPRRRRQPFLTILRKEILRFVLQLEAVPVVVFVTAALALWAYDYYGSISFFTRVIAERFQMPFAIADPASYFYWYGCAFVMLMLIPQLVLRATTRLKKDDSIPTLGWGLGDWRLGVPAVAIFYGVMLPILCVVVWTSDFQGKYPLYEDADRSVAMFVGYEAAYALYFIAWEYFFRGFMTFSLEKTLGIWTVFVQMLPFVVMHFGKPDLEAMSAVFGGIALGYLALRTRSFWYGVFIHAATAVTLDVLVVSVKHFHLR